MLIQTLYAAGAPMRVPQREWRNFREKLYHVDKFSHVLTTQWFFYFVTDLTHRPIKYAIFSMTRKCIRQLDYFKFISWCQHTAAFVYTRCRSCVKFKGKFKWYANKYKVNWCRHTHKRTQFTYHWLIDSPITLLLCYCVALLRINT